MSEETKNENFTFQAEVQQLLNLVIHSDNRLVFCAVGICQQLIKYDAHSRFRYEMPQY